MGSPFTGHLIDLLADRLDDRCAVGDAVLGWKGDPAADALALRLAGAFHALVLSKRSSELARAYPPNPLIEPEAFWPVIRNALQDHGDAVLRFIQTPPQTNEVARAAALASGFLMITARTGLPLALLEIGASAGLNLHWDRYGYDLGGIHVGQTDALPFLAPSWKGPPPPNPEIIVRERAGCDRSPVDIGSAEQRLRLRAYVWPDQAERQARLDQALAVAGSAPVPIRRADAAEWTSRQLARRRDGVATVLFHSIVWQYIPSDSQRLIERRINEAGRLADSGAPIAWLRMEAETSKAAALRLTLWPDGHTWLLADVDYHGRWIHWHMDSR